MYTFNSKPLWARAHYHLSPPLLKQIPFNNPTWVCTKRDDIQLFHLMSDHFIHKQVTYKINVIHIITLLLPQLHQASTDHYFQKVLESYLLRSEPHSFWTLQLLHVRHLHRLFSEKTALWTFCSLPTTQLHSSIFLSVWAFPRISPDHT